MKTTTVITFLSLASLLSLGFWSAPAIAEKPAKPTAVAHSSSTATATNTNIVNVITPPARFQSFAPPPSIDLMRVGVSVFTSLINPPHRADEIRAEGEVKKARINAQMELDREKMRIEANRNIDRVAPVLVQWGATRIPCTPGVVFVNGISADTVCINPSNAIPSGYYSYSAGNNLLVRAPENRPARPTARPAETSPAIPTAPASAYASISNQGF